jgi:hypothetical protein
MLPELTIAETENRNLVLEPLTLADERGGDARAAANFGLSSGRPT